MSEIFVQYIYLKHEEQFWEIKQEFGAKKINYERLKFGYSHSGEILHELGQNFRICYKLNSVGAREVCES